MGWDCFSFLTKGGTFIFPEEFDPAPFKRIDKKKQCDEISNSLDDFKRVFNGCKYPGIEMAGSEEKANAWLKRAQKFIIDAQKVGGSLKILKQRIDKIRKDTKSFKKLDKKLQQKLNAVASACDDYAPSINKKKLVPAAMDWARHMMLNQQAKDRRLLAPTIRAAKAAAEKGHPEIAAAYGALKKWSDDEKINKRIRQLVYHKVFNASRDMGQNMVNLTRMLKGGLVVEGITDNDKKTIPKLALVFKKYGNDLKLSFFDGMDASACAKVVQTIEANARRYDQIVGGMS